MEAIKTLLETQPLFSLFLTVALGFLAGEINIKGFSLGSGAVIFVGLALGGFAPKAAPSALLGTLGLLLFLYGVGVQYGAQFFRGLTSTEGLKANAAAAIGVIGAGCLSLALIPLTGIQTDQSLGLFAFFTREAITTICQTTINSINEFASGQRLSNEIAERTP